MFLAFTIPPLLLTVNITQEFWNTDNILCHFIEFLNAAQMWCELFPLDLVLTHLPFLSAHLSHFPISADQPNGNGNGNGQEKRPSGRKGKQRHGKLDNVANE